MKLRDLHGLTEADLMRLLDRREIGAYELTDEQLKILYAMQERGEVGEVQRDRDLNGELISLHPYWRKCERNTCTKCGHAKHDPHGCGLLSCRCDKGRYDEG